MKMARTIPMRITIKCATKSARGVVSEGKATGIDAKARPTPSLSVLRPLYYYYYFFFFPSTRSLESEEREWEWEWNWRGERKGEERKRGRRISRLSSSPAHHQSKKTHDNDSHTTGIPGVFLLRSTQFPMDLWRLDPHETKGLRSDRTTRRGGKTKTNEAWKRGEVKRKGQRIGSVSSFFVSFLFFSHGLWHALKMGLCSAFQTKGDIYIGNNRINDGTSKI